MYARWMRARPWLGFATSATAIALGCSGAEDASALDAESDALLDDASIEASSDGDALHDSHPLDAPLDSAHVDAPLDAHDAADAADAPPPPPIDTIPWETGGSVGFGVARKDSLNSIGENIFIAYAGYNVSLSSAEAWATAMYKASLRDRGVRWIWAVQGPSDPSYSAKEIGNSKIVAAMLPHVSASTKFVLVAGHSSGSFVAHELLGQLQSGLDPAGVTNKKVVYFDLDGGTTGLGAPIVDRLRRAYFVGSFDAATSTYSPNHADMQSAGATYPAAGGYWQNDASGSGCNAGAVWCVHVTLITTKPHDPTTGDPLRDYSEFSGRSVVHAYVDAKATEAGLVP